MRRRRIEQTPDGLRRQAKAELVAADEEAGKLLAAREEVVEQLERRADELEFARRVEGRRDEIAREAASLAQAALTARAAAAEAAVEADRWAERVADLTAQLEQSETLRRERLREVEEATAAGLLERAVELESALPSDSFEGLRSGLTVARASETAARDRAAQAQAEAEQHATAAASCRQALAHVEDDLRGEYDERRHKRELQALFRRLAFEQREQTALAVLADEANRKPPAQQPDSANEVLRSIDVRTDADGRFIGVDLPFGQRGGR